MTRAAQLPLLAAMAWLLSACHHRDVRTPPAAPVGSIVQIISVSPVLGTALRTGDKVKLKVEVEYTFTEESGTLNLVVQAADNSAIAHDGDVVLKGSGKVTLAAEFTVPATKMIQIFTPLAAQGQEETSIVDSRAFKVFPN